MPPSGLTAEALADRVVLIVKSTLAPVLTQCATLEQRCKSLEEKLADLGGLRERVAVAESRGALPGPAGPAGADGFSCDELTAFQDPNDERVITLAYRRGNETKTIGTLRLSTPRYCGVYDESKSYGVGDQVTYRGSQWHCHTATNAKPGEGANGWTLSVKCGRDGKDAR